MSGLARLFVAVDLGAAVRDRVARAIGLARLAAPRARWVPADGVHLTLVFLGAVAGDRVPAIAAAIGRAAARHRAMEINVHGAGTFGRSSSPRVLWLGVDGEVRALTSLQRDVAGELEAIGFPREERAFAPHLTLARAREERGDASLATAAERLGAFDAGSALVSTVRLVQSHLGPGGARYDVRAESTLSR